MNYATVLSGNKFFTRLIVLVVLTSFVFPSQIISASTSQNFSRNLAPRNEYTQQEPSRIPEGFFDEGKQERNKNMRGDWVQKQKILASDGLTYDRFYHLASSEDTLIIGASYANVNGTSKTGATYVFTRNLNGEWVENQKLVASDANANNNFGQYVSIDNETVLISSPFASLNGINQAGAAYVFTRNLNGEWAENQKLVASDASNESLFGLSSYISEELIIVGSPYANINGIEKAGAAYVFMKNSDGLWEEAQKIIPSDPIYANNFGWKISADQGILAISTSSMYGDAPGSVYIFVKDDDDVWQEWQKLTASDTTNGDQFNRISLSGNTLLVGAPYADLSNFVDAGAVYVFNKNAENFWQEEQKITANDMANDLVFGFDTAILGDKAIIGSPGHSEWTGAVYFLEKNSDGIWFEAEQIIASDGQLNDELGMSVSISQDFAFSGALNGDGAQINTGAVYVFEKEGGAVEPVNVLASFAADNYFAVYHQDPETGELVYDFRDDDGIQWEKVYSRAFTVAPDSYIYIVGFSDKASGQALIGQIKFLDTNQTIYTNPDWEVYGADISPWNTGNHSTKPSASLLQSVLDTNPEFSPVSDWINYGVFPWGTRLNWVAYTYTFEGQTYHIENGPLDPNTPSQWIWQDGMSATPQYKAENKEFYIFRYKIRPHYTISGIATDVNGEGVENVQILGENNEELAMTVENGYYEFHKEHGWTDLGVHAEKSGHVFYPEHREYMDLNQDWINQDYSENPNVETYTISGTVLSGCGANPTKGMIIQTVNSHIFLAETDLHGVYSFEIASNQHLLVEAIDPDPETYWDLRTDPTEEPFYEYFNVTENIVDQDFKGHKVQTIIMGVIRINGAHVVESGYQLREYDTYELLGVADEEGVYVLSLPNRFRDFKVKACDVQGNDIGFLTYQSGEPFYHYINPGGDLFPLMQQDFNLDTNTQYTLSYNAQNGGIIQGQNPQFVTQGQYGTEVIAQPNTSYHFMQWSDGIMTPNRTDGPIYANFDVTAEFAINQYTLTYTAGPGGSISGPTPQTIVCGGNSSPVTAVADTGYSFVQWSDGVTAAERTDGPIYGDLSVTAEFALQQFTITYFATPGGSVSLQSETVAYGQDSTPVLATANPGHEFYYWRSLCGEIFEDPINPLQITNVTKNYGVVAYFWPLLSISGTVTHQGQGLEGVAVTLNVAGEDDQTIQTNPDGTYAFSDIAIWSDVSVIAQKEGYSFNPQSYADPSLKKNKVWNFIADPETLIISGMVYSMPNDMAISGVDMINEEGLSIATTDENGIYSITVDYGFSDSLTPLKAGYTFTPISRSYTNIENDQINQNYEATPKTLNISGIVYSMPNDIAVVGVDMINEEGLSIATTDENGQYTISVVYGFSGNVVAQKTGYKFKPATYTYQDLTENQQGKNYLASAQKSGSDLSAPAIKKR